MGRILAIDYGKKRVGFAVTDPLQIIASPLDTLPEQEAVKFLKTYMLTEQVDEFVVGMPLKENGEPTDATPLVEQFIRSLKNSFPEMPIATEDEAYTSKQAVAIMVAAGIKKKERRKKGNVDKVSASLILQSYLNSKTD